MRAAPLLFLALVAAGCAGVRPQAAADDLRTMLAERTDAPVLWRTDAEADREADAAVARLIADSLSADEAVQIALLNSPRLQATYEDLGVAQASLVQAGLLRNPVFGGRALWGLDEGGAPDLGFNVAFEFLDVLWIPMRKRVAQSEYEATRLRVAESVLDLAARTRSAYTRAQADRLRVEFGGAIEARAEAAYTAARLLREAGTIPAADLLAEQARYEQARLDLVMAEQAALESREALTRTMGLTASTYRLGGR
ncbi:MAG: TolC family protein, partial [Bacteroidota bacterium]